MYQIPHKTIERLSQYRRALLICASKGKSHIFSHEIAEMIHITSVQVRRDLMLIGYTGNLRKGYIVQELIDLIGNIIDTKEGLNVALIGVGNVGHAIINYFNGKRTKLSIIAAFDNNPDKVGRIFSGVRCYHVDEMQNIIKKDNISIGIITTPAGIAPEIAEKLVESGIKGILNYTAKPVNVPEHIYLEEYDMVTSLEKVAFYVKTHDSEKF